MARLLALVEKHLGVGWIDISEWLRDQNTLDDIEDRLRAGDYDNVVEDLQEAAEKFAAETHSAYVTSGKTTAEWLDKQLPDSLVRFDQTNHLAVARAKSNQLELVGGLKDEQRVMLNQVLVDGTRNGTNPREMARDIRDSIGLAPNQEEAVRSYRRALENGDWSNALGRELSSGHSDRAIVAARKAGRTLSAEQVDTAVERYRQNFLTHRAETIARHEALRNVHQGNEDAFQQAIDRGDLDADTLESEWVPAPKTRYARKDHQAMKGQKRKFGEPFETPRGVKLRYPGDPDAPISETAGCRCQKTTRVVA